MYYAECCIHQPETRVSIALFIRLMESVAVLWTVLLIICNACSRNLYKWRTEHPSYINHTWDKKKRNTTFRKTISFVFAFFAKLHLKFITIEERIRMAAVGLLRFTFHLHCVTSIITPILYCRNLCIIFKVAYRQLSYSREFFVLFFSWVCKCVYVFYGVKVATMTLLIYKHFTNQKYPICKQY